MSSRPGRMHACTEPPRPPPGSSGGATCSAPSSPAPRYCSRCGSRSVGRTLTHDNHTTMKILRFQDLISQGRVKGRRVFIRADLNVPQDAAGRITEDTRIRASLPCLRMALDAGAAVMVTSHLGRPTEGQFKPEDSLLPVAARLAELLGRDVPLRANWVDSVDVARGQLVLLENCRVNQGEKKNDDALARKMAALCDIFVHDAFGTAH